MENDVESRYMQVKYWSMCLSDRNADDDVDKYATTDCSLFRRPLVVWNAIRS